MSRGNQVLAAILVVQVALAALVLWPRSASTTAGEPIFPGLAADQIVRVTITDETGEWIELEKSAGRWGLGEIDGYPCKEDVVPEFLDKIVGLTTGPLVTQTRASHKRLKVDDREFVHRVEIELGDGTLYRFYMGTSPSYGASHIRVDREDGVFLSTALSGTPVDARISTWVDTLYFDVPQDQIAAITLDNENGTFEFEKDDAGVWAMKGLGQDETSSENNIASLVNRVSSVRLVRPLGETAQEAYGLQDPSAVVTIHARDEGGATKVYALHVGARDEEDNLYVLKSSESRYYVYVSEYTVKDWIEKTREGFLELPPTPTPESAS